jgi:D-alanyl-D-alanine dipeptidase
MWCGDPFSSGTFAENAGLDPRWKKLMVNRLAGALGLCLFATAVQAGSGDLPAGFVYLADVSREIRQDMRYAGAHNFIGRRVEGYDANECILTERAARALVRVQTELAPRGLSLIVWDCYRPARAVRDFANWSKSPNEARMKPEFFPNTDKANFFQQGYLATRSLHSRGSTVDLGIVPSSVKDLPKFDPAAPLKPCTAPKGQRFEDGTIDFGTEHDCLDPQASTLSPNISREAQANRILLRDAMQHAGFRSYSKEWWHFELVDEPFQQAFDFPVIARSGAPAEKPVTPPAEVDKAQQPATIGSQWSKFKRAVLKRQAEVVASMTKFPLALTSTLLDEPAFLAEFDSIFDGAITGCIALQNPEQNNLGKGTFSLTCSTGGKQTILHFQIVSRNWQLFLIEGVSEAGKGRSGVERPQSHVEQPLPKAGRAKARQSPPPGEGGLTKGGHKKRPKGARSSPDAEPGPSNGERGPSSGEQEK